MNSKERFIYYSSPEHWMQTALELNTTIEELFEIIDKEYFVENYHPEEDTVKRPASSRAAFLLMSYTLENLLKGLKILRNANLINKGRLEKELKTHDLNLLSNGFEFTLSSEQIDFQDYISKLCISNARYPVGRNEHQAMKHPKVDTNHYQIYFQLFNKYFKVLSSELNENGWVSGIGKFNIEPGEFKFVNNPFYEP